MDIYKAQPGSPIFTLNESIDDTQDDSIEINIPTGEDLPEAPNLLTIHDEDNWETILFTSKDGNVIENITRGFEGEAQEWDINTNIARLLVAHDINSLQDYFNDTVNSPEILPGSYKDGLDFTPKQEDNEKFYGGLLDLAYFNGNYLVPNTDSNYYVLEVDYMGNYVDDYYDEYFSSISTGYHYLTGICIGPNNEIFISNEVRGIIHYDSSFSTIHDDEDPYNFTGVSEPQKVAFDNVGDYLIVLGGDGFLYFIDYDNLSDEVIEFDINLDNYITSVTDINSIVYFNSVLWIIDDNDDKLLKFEIDYGEEELEELEVYDISKPSLHDGLTFDDMYLKTIDAEDDLVVSFAGYPVKTRSELYK